ncbi:unnamed protein product [Closterium sp. NIES-65]|nr:unnamed protein product [Closterium sp. NIES-65]
MGGIGPLLDAVGTWRDEGEGEGMTKGSAKVSVVVALGFLAASSLDAALAVAMQRYHVMQRWQGWHGTVWGGMGRHGVAWDGMGWHGTAWGGMGWHGVAWDGMGWHGTAWGGMGRHGVAWDGMGWHGTAWGGMGRHGVAWDGMGWHGTAWGGMGRHAALAGVAWDGISPLQDRLVEGHADATLQGACAWALSRGPQQVMDEGCPGMGGDGYGWVGWVGMGRNGWDGWGWVGMGGDGWEWVGMVLPSLCKPLTFLLLLCPFPLSLPPPSRLPSSSSHCDHKRAAAYLVKAVSRHAGTELAEAGVLPLLTECLLAAMLAVRETAACAMGHVAKHSGDMAISYDKAVGERHVKIYPSEAVDSLPEGPERVKLLLQESEKEEMWKLDEFVKRMEFNKKQSVDATDQAAIKAAITSIDEECPIDILQCNAGIVRTGLVEDLSAEDVQSQVHTNFLGSVYPVQAVLPSMKARADAGEEPGAIVFTCSLAALVSLTSHHIYPLICAYELTIDLSRLHFFQLSSP